MIVSYILSLLKSVGAQVLPPQFELVVVEDFAHLQRLLSHIFLNLDLIILLKFQQVLFLMLSVLLSESLSLFLLLLIFKS